MPAPAGARDYDRCVFVNCPIDPDYRALFEAIIFTIADCGFVPRSALERAGTDDVRVQKIQDLIYECRFGIHDLSRVALDRHSRLPRFNMPLELGCFMGMKRAGDKRQQRKAYLVLDTKRYRYQKFCSDISGQDLQAHGNRPRQAIAKVRDFLSAYTITQTRVPSGSVIAQRYATFRRKLPGACRKDGLRENELNFGDLAYLIAGWIRANPLEPYSPKRTLRPR